VEITFSGSLSINSRPDFQRRRSAGGIFIRTAAQQRELDKDPLQTREKEKITFIPKLLKRKFFFRETLGLL
jgi:hypothetical protein